MIIEQIGELKLQLDKAISRYDAICILTHKNPDGDGLPASLALQELIRARGKKADVILEKPVSNLYDYLDATQRSSVFSEHLFYELVIILDCHEVERIGKCAPILHTARTIIAIDHHVQRQLIERAATYIDPSMVSVGAILFEIFEKEIEKLPTASASYIADAIYTTILNDTNNFINANTDKITFDIASRLFKFGLNPGEIAELFLMNKTPAHMRFVGEVLSTIQTYRNDKILFMEVQLAMLERNQLSKEATSKITSWVKGTKGVLVIICFQEVKSDRYRLSLRSNYLDVNKIAVKYGGGGHQKAAGCEIKGKLAEIKEEILEDIDKQL